MRAARARGIAMLDFDRKLTYQFGCLFGPFGEGTTSDEEIARIGDRIAAPVPETKIPVTFSSSQQTSTIVADPGGSVTQQPAIIWTGGAGIWKVVLSGARIDLFFNARGHADVSGQPPVSLSEVSQRVSTNFAEAISAARLPVNRIVLVVTGEATADDGSAAGRVAKQFLSREWQAKAEREELVEASARTAERTQWTIRDDGEQTPVHCIEQGAAVWLLEANREKKRLQWQLDVNTSPLVAQQFDVPQIGAFFRQGVAWVARRLDAIDK